MKEQEEKDEYLNIKDSRLAGLEVFESAKQRHDLLAIMKVRSSKQGTTD